MEDDFMLLSDITLHLLFSVVLLVAERKTFSTLYLRLMKMIYNITNAHF